VTGIRERGNSWEDGRMVRRKRMRWAAACGTMTTAFILSSCGGSSSGSPAVASVTSTSTTDLTSKTLPNGPAGTQLRWFLSSVAGAPLSQQEIDSHFDAFFLGKVTAAKINAALAELQVPGTLVGVLSSDATGLVVIANFGTARLRVTLSVDGSGHIDGLELTTSASVSSWSQIDQTLAALAPNVSFLAARVSNGSCQPIHQLDSSAPRPLASEFKLFVLGALANQVAAGQVVWNQKLTVENRLKSAGNAKGSGSLQFSPSGTKVSVQETATKMISISDNTAADMLINLVGRSAVETQVQYWSSTPQLDLPFLTTRETLLLHYVNYPALANAYLNRAPNEREAFLESSVDPLSLNELEETTEPRDIDTIEWFGSPDDICRAFVGLQELSHRPKLSPIASILSVNKGGLGLDPSEWPTVWFKGGSEPGVVTIGYLATNSKGQTFVVSAMLSDATAALAPSADIALADAVASAFRLMG
jgi:beta-lactamase class A